MAIGVSIGGSLVVLAPPATAATTYAETTGVNSNTWTNYTNAGGSQGPTIPAFTTVQIACRLTGFQVADGNTWWYQIASSPWNYTYYVSADPFYNNGATSGSLSGTPWVDTNVPVCGSGGGVQETTGGVAQTWTDYTNAGGTQGANIGSHATVTIACKISGFRVPDGNTWWYRIASSPWNNAFYVSADAFYNNGQTSGSLLGTPFVDNNVPDCTPSEGGGGGTTTRGETTGGSARTWSDYTSGGGTQGQTIPGYTTVQISCKVTGLKVTDGNTWWYLVASSPWSNQFYVSADAFYNNGATSGSLIGTPYVDTNVPDCSTGVRPSGETAGVAAHTWTDYTNAGGIQGQTIAAGQTVQVTCRVSGFVVADSDSWWYLISSSPWNNAYFVSADPFYNNGATSGSLSGTPFVDQSVPICGGIHVAPVPGTAYAVSSASTNHASCISGDPVNCASGDYFETDTDVAISGRGPGLNLTRTYNSLTASTSGIFGAGWSSSYDQHLVVSSADGSVTVTMADGSQVVAEPAGSGNFTMPAYVDSSLHQNSDGTFSLTVHARTIETFSSSGKLQSIADLNGYTTALGYSGGHLATVTDSAGRQITFTTGSNGLIASAADPLGRTVHYGYDSAGNLTSVVDPIGNTTSLLYDGSHLLTKVTDPRGGTVTNTFDSQGRILTQKDAAGLTNTWAYTNDNFSSVGGTTTITDPHGVVEVQRYANGFLNQIIKAYGTPQAATWSYTYDPSTFGLTSVTDPNGHVAHFAYDAHGNRISATDATGNTTTTTYNSLDEPLTVTTPLGEVTTRHYDSAGNLTSTTDAAGNTTTNGFDDPAHPGDVTSITNAAGHVASFTYDTNGDVASHTTHPSGSESDTSTFVSDADGETTCLVEPNQVAQGVTCGSGSTTPGTATQTIDADGRPTSVTDPAGNTTRYTYDTDGNITKAVNSDGHQTTRTFDADNRLTSTTTGADGTNPSTTSNAYDISPGSSGCPSGSGAVWCNSTTDADGHTTTAVFDALGDKVSEVRPGGRTTSFTYDAAGNLLTVVDAAGRTTTYAYDAANRRTSIAYSSASTHGVTYSYNADGRRTKMVDGTGSTTTTYDPNGRITSVTDGGGTTVSYGYDSAGEQTSITYPGNHLVTRTFDGAGDMRSLTDWQGHTTHFAYDADGNLTSTALPNGDSTDRSYDVDDQLMSTTTSSATGTLAKLTYSRDAAGLVTREVDTGALTGSTSYTYDAQGRLTSTNDTSYGYDPNGNLVTSGQGTQAYDGADELTSADNGAGVTTSYTYDATGDRTSTTPTSGFAYTYGYDQNGRLTSATSTPGPAPTVSSIAATSGTTYGHETVTITGTHLTGTTAVAFGSKQATSITVVSDTKLTVVSPAEAPGTQDVTVTTPSGTSATSSGDVYTFVPPTPAVASLSPASGPSTGHGTTVITGTGFTYATGVSFGATAALAYTVDSDTKITATTPGGALGSVNVQVTTTSGTSPVVNADRYTYVTPPKPTLASISPATGTTGGGTAVDIRGTGFWGTSKVLFAASAGTSVHVISSTELTVSSPAHAAGSVNVTLTTPGGTTATSAADVFKYVAPPKPAVTQVSPNSGSKNGGTVVTVTGTAFDHATKVTVGGAAVSGFTLLSPTSIRFTTSAHAVATVNIQVTTPGGTSALVAADRFTFVAPPKPAITSVSPSTGRTTGGTTVTITGTALSGATKVTFGGAAAKSFTVNSATSITAVTPAHAAGKVTTTVTTPAGVSASVSGDAFTYSATASARLAAHRRAALRMAAASVAGPVTTTYQYNGDGLRTSESNGSGSASFTWDITAGVPRILSDGTNDYIYGPDGTPIEQIAPTETDYFVTDVVGSTRLLLSPDGTVGATFSNAPYGDHTTSTGTLTTPLLFAGAYADPGSGLQYMVNRSYDPASGQFTTVDPLVDSSGSAYGYAAQDPVGSVDPSGLIAWRKDLDHVGKGLAVAGLAISATALIASGVGAPAGAAAIITGVGIITGGVGLGIDTGETIYDCNSTTMEYSRHCGGDAAGLIADSALMGVGVKWENKTPGDVAEYVDDAVAIAKLTETEPGESGYAASGGTATLTVSTTFVCISLQQSSTHATEYLQPAAHTSYFQNTQPTSYFQAASSAPVQQSSNVGSLLQGGSSSGGHIYLR